MKVWIKGKKNFWKMKWINNKVIDSKNHKVQLTPGWYYQTKNNWYCLSFGRTMKISRLCLQDEEFFWYPNPYSKFFIERIEFEDGTYQRKEEISEVLY